MSWRFADLPIRTKFMVTLGIPVLGLVLLIGKQVDSSLKRSRVLGYVSRQAGNIQLIGDVMDALQQEDALTVALLERVVPNKRLLELARTQGDARAARLDNAANNLLPLLRPAEVLAPLAMLRKRVDAGQITTQQADLAYQGLGDELMRGLGEVSKQAGNQEVNNKLFAHQSLLHAKQAMGGIRTLMVRGLVHGLDAPGLDELNARTAQYETNMALFERDAASGVLDDYRATFQGPDVNFLRSVLAVVRARRNVAGLDTDAAQWWEMSGKVAARLRTVEEASIASIMEASNEASNAAQRRLVLVLVALMLVVGTVIVMAMMIMNALRSTISEVTQAAATLAKGDVRARVPVKTKDELGQMAGSFNAMIEAIRSLSASADAIGQGNYETPVVVRGEQDALGHSLARMRDNLKAARERDRENNRALLGEKEKLEQANARIQTLIREIHHRVKNNLQLVSSMLRLQSGTLADERMQQVFAQSQSRVASMALLHEKLYKGDDLAQLNLAQYIRDLFAELVQLNKVQEKIRYRTAIDPDLVLDMDTMVPLGLILNELITNSFKHAFSPGQEGFVNLRIHRAEADVFDLNYGDNGKGMPEEKRDKPSDTLGRSLIDSLVEQLNGTLRMESDSEGTRYHIRFRAG